MNTEQMEQLIPLLSKRIDIYTSKESSSIPYTTARKLMESILYCIEMAEYNTTTSSSTLPCPTDVSIEESFEIGLAKVKEMVLEAKLLYQAIEKDFYSYQNICYYETIIKGMPAFFLYYDPGFDAKNILLTLDYPLLYENINKDGAAKIYEYLKRIQLEQRLLARFPRRMVNELLSGYDPNYSELILNISTIVLSNALGHILLNESAIPLQFTEGERERLKVIGITFSYNQLKQLLLDTLAQLIRNEYNNDASLYDYLSHHMERLTTEFKNCANHNCMERLFIAIGKIETKSNTVYEEGFSMLDEDLRSLINEMQDLRFLSDKLLLLKKHAKSLSDLKELLETCFYPGEFESVFQLLTPLECTVMKEEIQLKLQFDQELYTWEIALMNYII